MLRKFTAEWFEGFLDGFVAAIVFLGVVLLVAMAARPSVQAWRATK